MFNVKKLFLIILVSVLACSQIGNSTYIGDLDTAMRFGKYSILPYSYVIEPFNSTHYQSINASGYVYQSTNSSAVWNNARGNLSSLATGATGSIFVKNGTYQVDSPWILGKKTHLVGESNVLLNATTNSDVIQIDSSVVTYTDWRIENIRIDMVSWNGNGIYSSNASSTDSRNKQIIRNVYIENVATAYAGISLVNAFIFDFSQIRITTDGTGILFALDNNLIAGNGVVSNVIIGLGANDAVGVDIQNTSAKMYNLITFTHLQVNGAIGALTGTYGIKANGLLYSQFNNLNLEYQTTNIYLNNSAHNTFVDCFILGDGSTNASSGVLLEHASWQNTFTGGYIGCSEGAWSYVDNSTANSYLDNMMYGVEIYRDWEDGSNTKFRDCTLWNTDSDAWRYSNIASGSTIANDEWVTHNLASTPVIVLITPRTITLGSVTFTVSCYDQNSTHFKVKAYWTNGTAITADSIAIYWYASISG